MKTSIKNLTVENTLNKFINVVLDINEQKGIKGGEDLIIIDDKVIN